MKVIQKEVLKRYQEIAEKHNVTIEELMEVESSMWKMVTTKMSEGDRNDFSSFHNIYIAGLGTFYASEPKWRHINKLKKDER